MQCPECKSMNDHDSLYCVECGKTLQGTAMASPARSRRTYLFIFVLAPVLALVLGVGYYKFFLPNGIAAVVNGEEIRLSELDAVVSRLQGNGVALDSKRRYQALNMMITERLVLQEARKAGIEAAPRDVAAAVADARVSSGLDEAAFLKAIAAEYGSMSLFEGTLKRRLTASRFMAEKVVPRNADAETVRVRVNQWMQDLSGRATVRIALSQEVQGPGCSGGCNAGAGPGQPCQGVQGQGCAKGSQPMGGCDRMAQKSGSTDKTTAAADAGLRYWHEKHGPQEVTTQVKDLGCHMQVNIVKNEKIIGSLRYQNGSISEL